MERGFNIASMEVRHGKCRNQVWTPQRLDRLNDVALAVRTPVSLGLSADLLRSNDVDIVRRKFFGSNVKCHLPALRNQIRSRKSIPLSARLGCLTPAETSHRQSLWSS